MPKKKTALPMSNQLTILVGVQGSGKSTLAKQMVKSEPSLVRVSSDDFRKMLKDEWWPGEEVENLVASLRDQAISESLSQGWNVVLDNTNCNIKALKSLIKKFGSQARVVLKIVGADLSMKEIYAQDNARDKSVGQTIIDKTYKGFKEVLKSKADIQKYIDLIATPETLSFGKQDDSLPKAIIVDIDGTIAHMENRGPFDWSKVDSDAPDIEVLNLIRTLSTFYKVLFVTGRSAEARKVTEAWLGVYYGQDYEKLYTRGSGDFRPDNEVKEEVFNTHIKGKYYIEAVFDDRDQVVEMWRKRLGLKCLQVDYGDF